MSRERKIRDTIYLFSVRESGNKNLNFCDIICDIKIFKILNSVLHRNYKPLRNQLKERLTSIDTRDA